MQEWFFKLGAMGYPLLVWSFLTIVLLVERLIYYLATPSKSTSLIRSAYQRMGRGCDVFHDEHFNSSNLLVKAGIVLAHNSDASLENQKYLVGFWIGREKKKLYQGLPWLQAIAATSPILGLLGTILGIIQSFHIIANTNQPVTPALIAGGLWEAMLTTAVGMAIALPALLGVYGFKIWAGTKMDQVRFELSRYFMERNRIYIPKTSDSQQLKPSKTGSIEANL